jgi:cytosine/adenosine deaminase-related metal-dependent hydrolase
VSTRFVAARVLPDAHTDLAPGAVVVDGNRIAWVGRAEDAPPAETTVELPEAVLTPGLVNAHSHLDLTHLRGRIPYEGEFASWLKGVARGRGATGERDAAAWGVREALARGTTAFGDVVSPRTFPLVLDALGECGARARVFVEAIGLRPQLADEVFDRVWELVEMEALPPLVETGVAPHAPYSVSRPLLERLVAVADGHDRPLSVHVAETLEELAFLRHGIGPLRELSREFGVDDPELVPHGSTAGFLKLLDLRRAQLLLVHCNYMRPRDVPPHAIAIYCPTAHHFFGHPEHPALELMQEGVRVAIGSDSAASGDSVDTLSETQFLARARLDFDPRQVFQMATEWGACALGFDAGTLAPGRLADLAAFEPAAGHEVLGLVDARCVLTAVDGRILHHDDGAADVA